MHTLQCSIATASEYTWKKASCYFIIFFDAHFRKHSLLDSLCISFPCKNQDFHPQISTDTFCQQKLHQRLLHVEYVAAVQPSCNRKVVKIQLLQRKYNPVFSNPKLMLLDCPVCSLQK